MYQTDWGIRPQGFISANDTPNNSKIDMNSIESVYLLHWSEHCIECSVPQCYKLCPLFIPRKDQKCARFCYGIYPNQGYHGLYNYGADIQFRRWGKIESYLNYSLFSVEEIHLLSNLDKAFLSVINPISGLISPINRKRRLNGLYFILRDNFLKYLSRRKGKSLPPHYFIIEAWNPGTEKFNMIIEVVQSHILFRDSIPISPGYNLHKIPCDSMTINFSKMEGKIFLYPENDVQARIIFTWLDFVRYKTLVSPGTKTGKPAAKVKCLAWDLDNTLWEGILIEDGPEALQARPECLELIRQLDEKGIIQTIVSKNDYQAAWAEIQKLGLEDYFLYPAINWGPKSKNIQEIAKELNIGIDTFALIDDSSFERGEVSQELPQVRVYSEKDVTALLYKPEFNVPISEESKKRRISYLADGKRKRIMQSFGENYIKFLESCQLEADVFIPTQENNIKRCLELLQRSNQLNLSTHRYVEDEFLNLLANPEVLSLAISCKDRFGEYGTVAFLSIGMSEGIPIINDFVISCRIAQKKVENAICYWLFNFYKEHGYDRLVAMYIPSQRNGVLLNALAEVGFIERENKPGLKILELSSAQKIPYPNIVTINDLGVKFKNVSGDR